MVQYLHFRVLKLPLTIHHLGEAAYNLIWYMPHHQEKAAIQGWLPVEPGELTAAQLGAALGNAWPLPLAARIVYQLNRSMDWSRDAKDPMK